RGVSDQAQVRSVAEDQLQPLAQSRQPRPEAVRGWMESDTSVGDTDHAAITGPCDIDVDPASFLAGVDPVSHGILDQRQECGRRTANLQGRRVDVPRVMTA